MTSSVFWRFLCLTVPFAVLAHGLPALGQSQPDSEPSVSAPGDVGIISIQSSHSVHVTSDRLQHLIQAQGMKLYAAIDHEAVAGSAKLALRPTMLLVFADPRTNTLLLHQEQALGLDLPMKFLVWEAQDHAVYISWNNPYYLARRYGIALNLDLLSQLSQTLVQLAKKAAQ
jgi:uncharacterized protein (DUF302 family)